MDLFWMIVDKIIEVGTLITIVWAVKTVLSNAHSEMVAPDKLQDNRISNVEKRCDVMSDDITEIKDRLSCDYKRLSDHEKFMELSIKAQLALVNHALSGNNIDELESVKDEFCEKTSVVFTNKESREREEENK